MQQVPDADFEEKEIFVGPILHISYSVEDELKEPPVITIPITLHKDQIKSQNLLSSHIRVFYRWKKSQEWVEISRQLKTPATLLENGVVTFQVNDNSK